MVRAMNNSTAAFPTTELRPLNGTTELAVAEATAQPGSRPQKVSCVLNAIFATIGEERVTLAVVRQLPCGTREWLLQQAAQYFYPDVRWFESHCTHCGHPYDLSLNLADAASYQPESDVLQVEVETSLGMRSFFIPNGAHEEAFAKAGPIGDPRRRFAALCGLSEQAEKEAMQFDEDDIVHIDHAIEAASPDVSVETTMTCPFCGKSTTARIDPLLFAFPHEGTILQETHLIAMAYGWPHDQILGLKVRHRSALAAMIARDYRQTRRPTSWKTL
ncbi:MAG: hypothetical protein NPIRA02_09770 [Nitrospirales bacterium]|nr:MAG: hypothetical protein NPIRA02_09770 [Nitrospirales bacterium]